VLAPAEIGKLEFKYKNYFFGYIINRSTAIFFLDLSPWHTKNAVFKKKKKSFN